MAKLFYVISCIHYLNAAPCKSYKWDVVKKPVCTDPPTTCKPITTCEPVTTDCPEENKWDYWCILQPLLLALYIMLAALLVLLLLSCICRMCSKMFVKCGCDTWFRPCFCFDNYSDSNCSLISASAADSCICDDKECPLFKQASVSQTANGLDPLLLVRQMKEDGLAMKKSALDTQHHIGLPHTSNQSMIPSEDEEDTQVTQEDLKILKSLSTKKKLKLLRVKQTTCLQCIAAEPRNLPPLL
ncbi:putative electron transfer flavoprotein subunit [Homalodisca vitripennis]|nr:putative electron transfer flavoprotein subunit [Homalodisca vitripennis]